MSTPVIQGPARHSTRGLREWIHPHRRSTDALRGSSIPRLVTWLSLANLAIVASVMALICFVSERWWLSASLSFLPRLPWAIPAVVLLFVSLLRAPWMALVNGAAIAIVVGPIMGLTLPMESPKPAGDHAVRLVSSNVQVGAAKPQKLVLEIEQLAPDIVVLQEAHQGTEEFDKLFGAWQSVRVGEFWTASRFPIRLVDEFSFEPFGRRCATLCEVETPGGPVLVCNVHLNTPRHAMSDLQWHSLLTGAGIDEVSTFFEKRQEEARALREFVETRAAGRQFVVAGDFNTPAFSSTLVESWKGYSNAFEAAGSGYGYTSPCNTRSYWPSNTPWVRIDHILYPAGWTVHAADIGRTNGSDHRLIYADLTPDAV